jgi:hypothetical protein
MVCYDLLFSAIFPKKGNFFLLSDQLLLVIKKVMKTRKDHREHIRQFNMTKEEKEIDNKKISCSFCGERILNLFLCKDCNTSVCRKCYNFEQELCKKHAIIKEEKKEYLKNCFQCGYKLNEKDNFCGKCGYKL